MCTANDKAEGVTNENEMLILLFETRGFKVIENQVNTQIELKTLTTQSHHVIKIVNNKNHDADVKRWQKLANVISFSKQVAFHLF